MPYIKKEDRDNMDVAVKALHKMGVKPDGKLNYVLFKYFLETVGTEPGYNDIKNYCAEIEEAAREIRRRFLAGYENEKKEENGDVLVDKTFMHKFKMQRFA